MRTVDELRQALRTIRTRGSRVALVPTMGALHEGHMSLIRAARQHADTVCVTIFVNPKQFGPNEDFAAYPRQMRDDCSMLEDAGVELLFAPAVEEMYPAGFVTTVHVADLTAPLCGADRPNHFDGVATVVTKLLLQALPDVAMFGEKDYQQLLVVKRLVRDLDIPVRIQGCPTWREPDGFALSSRNKYLSAEQRAIAPALHRALQDVAAHVRAGGEAAPSCASGARMLRQQGFASVDYLEMRDAETLALLPRLGDRPARVFGAARIGRVRLIDNIAV
ncbi:MAG TPA: pantoate--beta-alanine ligase [Geminicoccaceae bacterium]|nr:pantoate--beta-alanine ligase [Geminicoccaceae bacterium]